MAASAPAVMGRVRRPGARPLGVHAYGRGAPGPSLPAAPSGAW